MDVRLPDGTVVRNVPEGTTKAQLMAKVAKMGAATARPFDQAPRGLLGPPQIASMGAVPANAPNVPQNSASDAFGAFALKGLLNNAMTAPRAAGDLIAMGGAAIPAGVNMALGRPSNFDALLERSRNTGPAGLLRAVPAPTVQGIQAGIQSIPALMPGGQSPGDAFAQNRAAIADQEAQLRSEHPFAAGAGDVAGDALTLAIGRGSIGRRFAKGPEAEMAFGSAQAAFRSAEPGVRRTLDRFASSKAVSSLGRGLGRAAETGFEGALLGAIHDADPAQQALYGAVAQMAGSSALTLSRKPITYAALAAAATLQVFKSATPGGSDSVLKSLESGFDKAVALTALGAAAGLAGLSRGRGSKLIEEMPAVVEGGTALLRGGLLSVLRDATDEQKRGVDTTARTLAHLASDPGRFSEPQLKALERGFRDGDLAAVANRLAARDESFAAVIDSAPSRASSQAELRDLVAVDNRGTAPTQGREAASALASRLGGMPKARFEKGSVLPRAFVAEVFRDADALRSTLPRLGEKTRAAALELNLTQLLTTSTRRVGGRSVIDGDQLRKQWERLPNVARDAYSDSQRKAIEAFIQQAQIEPLTMLPPLLARSLTIDGALSSRLRGVNDDGE